MRNPKEDLLKTELKTDRRSEITAFMLLALSAILFVSLATFDYNDSPLFVSTPNASVSNLAGIAGAWIAGVLLIAMGLSAYAIPVLALIWSLARFAGRRPQNIYYKLLGTIFLILATSSLASLLGIAESSARFRNGGVIGLVFSDFLLKYLGTVGSYVAIILLFLLSVLVATEFLILPFMVFLFRNAARLINALNIFRFIPDLFKARVAVISRKKPAPAPKAESGIQRKLDDLKKRIEKMRPVPAPPKVKETREEPAMKEKPVMVRAQKKEGEAGTAVKKPVKAQEKPEKEYVLPDLSLLDSPPPLGEREIREDLSENSKILEETLADFEIEAKVVNVDKGPVITRYELEPAAGVKVHRITSLSDNIALAMKAQSVRIVAPIPGKGTIGVEVPNSHSSFVYLKEVLESEEFGEEDSKLKLVLGKSIAGEPVITDLASMPHLLIAGATGSGKTVCVNSIIITLLFNATPDELKFLMVDPKRVELACFNDLPHLLSPVVTEAKKVSAALDWVVNEMDSRYELFAQAGVRNITIFNEKAKKEGWENLPYIVVIIDELADLMLVAQQEIENAITRLAQLSRAVGIHIILATQRPSVDVITGVIKANFPSRIAFKVASKVDSRTVLDMNGAEKLLGKGDMLFVEPGEPKPARAQGALVTDAEIEKITAFIKDQRGPGYVEDIQAVQKKAAYKKFEKDEIYDEAVKVVIQTRQASVSMLQRRLGVGYTRAARLIDMMEDDGIVGPYQGSKPRDILVENIEDLQASEE